MTNEISKEMIDKVLEAIEVAKATGKIKKGTNEVTKAIEKGIAKLVAIAKDASPPEIVMHIPLLAKEKGILCVEVPTKEALGASTGIDVPTASAAVVQEGDSKALIKEITEKLGAQMSPPKESETKEAPGTQPKADSSHKKEKSVKEKK